MDFARKQLEKYGWTDGKGLGKNEDGISNALKPKLKFDNAGIGHDVGKQFTDNWWEKLFNSAAQNIEIETGNKNEIKMRLKSEDAVEITTKSYSLKQLKKDNSLEYGSFIKTEKLSEGCCKRYKTEPFEEPESVHLYTALTDDELFAACGGRTVHKGARHGLKLSGKLSRIEKQEKILLKKMKKVSLSDHREKSMEKKLKKIKKQKEDNKEKYTPIVEDSMESTSSSHMKKKSNKKRKSVSFNETVTKIYTVDVDTSFDSEVSSIRDESSNGSPMENIATGSDEGIEQDIENNNKNIQDNHRSFEEAQFNISDLSKAERKKLKKKRKLEAKKNTSTGIFLQKLNDDNDAAMTDDIKSEEVNLKKRKYADECGHSSIKRHPKTDSPDRHKCKKSKKKRKQLKMEEKQLNSIVKSLDFCRISESE